MKYLKTFEEKSKGQEIIYTFKTKAKSGKYDYTIHILQGKPKYDETNGYSYNGLVISIDSTPGSWYISTFLHYTPDSKYKNTIHINGNDWVVTNGREIAEELEDWLKYQYPVYKDVKKYNL